MPLAEVYRQGDQFRADLLAGERQAARRLVGAYAGVQERIQAEIADLLARRAEAEKRGEDLRGWELRENRLRVLQAQVEREVRTFADRAEGVITAEQASAARAGADNAQALLQAAAGEGVGLDFARLPRPALERLVGYTADGAPLARLLAPLGLDAAERVGAGLVRGLAVGKGPAAIARDIRDALGGNLARALTIARTETLRAYREATRGTFQENSDIVTGWRWRSARSERTCPACWAMDGREFPLDEPMPSHPNCRCYQVPVFKSLPGLPAERDTGRAPTGAEAFEALKPAQQREVLGPHYQAYADGEYSLADFARVKRSSVWGASVMQGRPRPGGENRLPGR